MVKTALPIANGFYVNPSLPVSAQQCVNAYPKISQAPALSPETLRGSPGLNQIAESTGVRQANRGAHVKAGIAYFVNGTMLYRLTRTIVDGVDQFAMDTLGTIPGTDRVSMADNGTQLMILVPGGNGFIFDEDAGTPFQQITDADFVANGAPQYVVFLDGYFVITTDTKKFIISELNDGLAYDALDFGTAEADPDTIVAPIAHRNQLFIAGSETIEVFQNVGGAGFPFQRVEGFVMPVGVSAPLSIVEVGGDQEGGFAFIGGGTNEAPSIRMFTGGGTVVISTDAVDAVMEGFTQTEFDQVFAFSYSQDSARFVVFSFPTTTLVFDTTSGRWHERQSQIVDASGTRTIRWRANSLVKAYDRLLVGDSEDGRIGEVGLDLFDEYGGNIIRRVSTMPFSNNGEPVFISSLELTMEAGVGDLVTIDPQIRLSRSKDGKTFGPELFRSIGKIGEYTRRAIWRRLGRAARFELFEFTFSDKVKFVIIKLEADIAG